MQALLPCKHLLGLGKWNTISATGRCASLRAASHWTWLAVLAALSRKAGLAQHDVPESGGMLFAELLHCVCIVCGLHCFDTRFTRFWIQIFVSCKSKSQKLRVLRVKAGDFKQLVPYVFQALP
jgi:hypothetical protein